VKQLIAYLLDHAIIDFSGDLTLDMVRDFLREDDSPEGRKLLGKLVEDRGVDDMVVTLADCLQDYLRSGITEEVVRFRGHLDHWRALSDSPEPCGRKLDFLLQEMNREVNTVGSKAEGPAVSEVVVSLKAELEKMREQVQNVE